MLNGLRKKPSRYIVKMHSVWSESLYNTYLCKPEVTHAWAEGPVWGTPFYSVKTESSGWMEMQLPHKGRQAILTRNKEVVRKLCSPFCKQRLISLPCLKPKKFDFLVHHKIFNFNLKVFGKVLFPPNLKGKKLV